MFEDYWQDKCDELKKDNALLLVIVRRMAKISCCLCRDECLKCDAYNVLKQIGDKDE